MFAFVPLIAVCFLLLSFVDVKSGRVNPAAVFTKVSCGVGWMVLQFHVDYVDCGMSVCCTALCCCCFVGWESALKEVEDA